MSLDHLSEYRDKSFCLSLAKRIRQRHRLPVRLMEVCGTHTMSISRFGIRDLLPDTISLLSGPGCPVCVTSQGEIDQFIKLSRMKNVILATFGDLMRVPGSQSSLQRERASGADVRIVYSALDCLQIAKDHQDKDVVFLGVGFETTAPTIAAAIITANKENVSNFFVISAHKLVPPALMALLEHQDVNVNGFICPGHVSVIIGGIAYEPIVDAYKIPSVIAGFEPVDILQSVLMLVEQIESGESKVEIAYKRGVTYEGNRKAREIMYRVFEPVDAVWRGLGMIQESGLKIHQDYEMHDAVRRFDLQIETVPEPAGCICGSVLSGIKTPSDCPLFAKRCTPDDPVGPCMVSTEGACAAHYKYHRI
ncbi:MAG: hydrogenase formation protein HypD [candidate division KSB1 bacterium]|nr:hydrogenase formation protein HypD [candidate division KSB1 bacterium]